MTSNIPAKYKPSVESLYRKGDPNSEGDEVVYYFNLKNATAFGYPIKQIEYLQGYEWSHLKLKFKDNKFMALRPSFQPPKPREYEVIEKNDMNGYEGENGGYFFLKFNAAENSITCGSGV